MINVSFLFSSLFLLSSLRRWIAVKFCCDIFFMHQKVQYMLQLFGSDMVNIYLRSSDSSSLNLWYLTILSEYAGEVEDLTLMHISSKQNCIWTLCSLPLISFILDEFACVLKSIMSHWDWWGINYHSCVMISSCCPSFRLCSRQLC